MADRSHLDQKYFINPAVYNCPFCNRRNVKYSFYDIYAFDWSNNRICFVYFIRCSDCKKTSMHLSYSDIRVDVNGNKHAKFRADIDIDSYIFYSVPTSFFVMDIRIQR